MSQSEHSKSDQFLNESKSDQHIPPIRNAYSETDLDALEDTGFSGSQMSVDDSENINDQPDNQPDNQINDQAHGSSDTGKQVSGPTR
jgi:hypothetical protein